MKRIITFALALAMAAMLLSGCSGGQPQNETAAAETETVQQPTAAPQWSAPSGTGGVSAISQGENMVGRWVDSTNPRITMKVERKYDGFAVTIYASNSAFETEEWRMTGSYENVEGGRIVSDDCSKVIVTYDPENDYAMPVEQVVYTAGMARITSVNGCLYWFDAQDDEGEGLMFVPNEYHDSYAGGEYPYAASEPQQGYQPAAPQQGAQPSAAPQQTARPAATSKPSSGSSATPKPSMVKCPECGNYYEEGNIYRNHICSGRQEPVDGYNAGPNTMGLDMVGEWVAYENSRVTMSVKAVYDGFGVTIRWTDSAYESYEWRMTGNFVDEEDGRIYSNDCKHVLVTYGDSGRAAERTIYDDGRAAITYVNGMLYWNDYQEGEGDDLMFVRSGSGSSGSRTPSSGSGSSGSSSSSSSSGSHMAGRWADYGSSRASMEISGSNGYYYITINWKDSAFQAYEWRMSGSYSPDVEDGRISCYNCEYVLVTYGEYGVADEDVIYTGGSATITSVNGMLYWNDMQDGAGDDLIFERA